MTTPDFRKYGYEPETDSKNHFSYVKKGHSYGKPYRIGAAPDGEGGWSVYIDWKQAGRHDRGQHTTYYKEHIEDRFGAAMVIERAMKEHAGTVTDTSGEGSVDPEFDFGGGL